ncbi:MAG: hypothetical protein ABI844_18365 [Saprospiraceae bacterium]
MSTSKSKLIFPSINEEGYFDPVIMIVKLNWSKAHFDKIIHEGINGDNLKYYKTLRQNIDILLILIPPITV